MALRKSHSDAIVKYLHENPDMTSTVVAANLESMHIYISASRIARIRREKGIPYTPKVSLAERIRRDIALSDKVPSGSEIVAKYGCCISHANKSIQEALGVVPARKRNKAVVAMDKVSKDMKPVRIGTFDHMFSQLTAGKFVQGM